MLTSWARSLFITPKRDVLRPAPPAGFCSATRPAGTAHGSRSSRLCSSERSWSENRDQPMPRLVRSCRSHLAPRHLRSVHPRRRRVLTDLGEPAREPGDLGFVLAFPEGNVRPKPGAFHRHDPRAGASSDSRAPRTPRSKLRFVPGRHRTRHEEANLLVR